MTTCPPVYETGAPPSDEGGFALIAALLGALIFAFIAYSVLAADRGALTGLDAQLETARLEAAADAGLATAIQGLATDSGARWPINGATRALSIDGVDLSLTVQDELGKVPVNRMDKDQARRLFEAAGVSGVRLDQITDSFLDWEDGGQRPNGARPLDYAAQGLAPRGGPIRTIDELAQVKGMDDALLARIAPALTLYTSGTRGFDPQTATPLAAKVMAEAGGADTPDAIVRAREAAGERTAFSTAPVQTYVGRPITVQIVARDSRGGLFRRATTIELTGQPAHPYWIHEID